MASYVRGNEIVISCQFIAQDGSGAVPTQAQAQVTYINTSGSQSTDTVPMTLGADGVTWSGSWNSTPAAVGRAYWFANCWNGLVAAADGEFVITANPANPPGSLIENGADWNGLR